MRPSIQLDPSRLKLYRQAVPLTQRELAIRAFDLASRKSGGTDNREDMYHKIEKTGRMSPKRAARLATALNVKLDDLLPDANEIKTLWWISASIGEDSTLDVADSTSNSKNLQLALGSTVYGVVAAVAEIRSQWLDGGAKRIQYGHIISANADFGSSEFGLEIRHYTENKQRLIQTHTFVARPIVFAPEKGILWRDADTLEKNFFSASIRDFVFYYANTVSIDGATFPPQGFKQCYQVKVTESVICNQDEIQTKEGTRYFLSNAEFYISISEWMRSDHNKFVRFMETLNGIDVVGQRTINITGNTNVISKNISILRGWIDADEKFQVGPWPISDRKPLIDGQVNPKNAHLLFSADTPRMPFEPNLIIKTTAKIR